MQVAIDTISNLQHIMRPFYHPQSADISLVGVLYALGDPVRLQIVQRLAQTGELTCSDLDCAVAKSTMSHHFRILRAAGVVATRKEGTQLINSLRREDLDGLFPGLLDIVVGTVNTEIHTSP